MADPIVVPPTPAADPTASRSAFSDASSAPAPAGQEAAAFDQMLAEAGKLMGDPQAQKPVEKVQVAETPTVNPSESTKRPLPPPIKGNTPPPAEVQDPATSPLTEDDLKKLPFEQWPRDAKSWKENRDLHARQVNHYKAELARLKDLAKAGGPEVAEILKERDTLRDELRAIAVERDPAFKAEFDAAFGNVRQSLESLLSKDDVDKALTLFDSKPGVKRTEALEKLVGDMSPFKQNAVMAALMKHDEVARIREQKIAENTKNWDKKQFEARTSYEQAEQARINSFKGALENTVKEWTDPKSGYAFMSRTGDPAKDKPIDEMVSLAETILTGTNTPDEMARAAMYAALSPRLLTTLGERDARISALEAELASLKSASPSLRSAEGLPDSTRGTPAENYLDALTRSIQEAGLPLR